jgi:hypothetical protein
MVDVEDVRILCCTVYAIIARLVGVELEVWVITAFYRPANHYHLVDREPGSVVTVT